MRSALRTYFGQLIRHRYLALGVAAALVVAAAVGASRVPLDFTMEQFFPGWGPERERYDVYKESFPKEDMQISLFWSDSRPIGADVYRDLRKAASYFVEAGLEDVRWFGDLQVADAAGGRIRVHPLIEPDSVSDAYVRIVLELYVDDDFLRGNMWNAEQTVFAIHGALSGADMESDLRRREIDETLQARLEVLAGEGTEFALSGVPITRSRIPDLLNEDQRRFIGTGVIVFLLILFLFFRHPGQVFLCLVSILPAYFCTVAIIGLSGKTVTVLTGFIPIIVLVVGGADIVHVLTRYRQLRASGLGNKPAIVEAFTDLASACFYTSLTTAIGFLSLIGTRIGIVMDFGAFTAVAIFLTYGFSMTLLPVLLSFYRRESFKDVGLDSSWIVKTVGAAASLATRPSRWLLAAFALVSVIGLGLALTLRVDSYLIDDLKKSAAVRRDLIWVEESGFGIYQVVVHLRQSGERPLHHPDALRWMKRLEDEVADDPVVVNTFALHDIVRRIPWQQADGTIASGTLPATSAAADGIVTSAMMYDPDVFKDVYRPSDGEAQVIITVKDAGSRRMLPFLQRVDAFLAANPLQGASAVSTGTVKLIQNYSAQVLRNFAPSLVAAIILIFLVMSLMFRSFRHGLIALIPNFFPLIVLLAAMRLLGFALKPSTILVCSIAFGLAVDDSIHVLGRFRRAIWAGDGLRSALEKSVRGAGPAILMTTVVVSAGFAVLMASRFEVLFLVGMMTVISAVAAVVADLFVFPTLISLAWRRTTRESSRARLPLRLRAPGVRTGIGI